MKEDKKKVYIRSFGCQMNKLDSALVSSALEEAGFCLTGSIKEADAVIINTCSVREHAEQRVYSQLGHIKHIKKNRPDLIVAVIGCMAQRLGEKLLEHEAVDLVCGPAQISQIPELVTTALQEKKKHLTITESIRGKPSENQSLALEKFESSYGANDKQLPGQAFVRAMHGCNNFCSFCVVPYVRGPEVCRPPSAIIEQIKKLADNGIKQVTLLGQTINSYKYVSGEKTWCLADLLDKASDIAGIKWLKFVTSYPSGQFFDELLQVMAGSEKVCKYLHIPAQSGSDKILRAMNRHYTAEEYLGLIEKARDTVPGIAVAGDFIVGFPGETEDDFQATISLIEKALYKNSFIFKYSPRPGTKADKRLQDDVHAEVKQSRIVQLLAVQEKISDRLSRDFLDRDMQVLVEGPSKKAHVNSSGRSSDIQLVGRNAEDWIVIFNGPKSLAGEFVKIKITQTSPLTLFGRLV